MNEIKTVQHLAKGFTLIELMIVVAVIAVVAAIALPSYQEQVRRARRADAMSAVMDCVSDQERRYSARSVYADTATAQSEALCGFNSASGQLESAEGHYTLAITTGVDAFTITAQPTNKNKQDLDTNCDQFIITETGQKSSKNSGGTTTTDCWKK